MTFLELSHYAKELLSERKRMLLEISSFIFDSRIIDNCWKSYFVLKWHKRNTIFFLESDSVNHLTPYVCMKRSLPIKLETFFLEERLHDYMEGSLDH